MGFRYGGTVTAKVRSKAGIEGKTLRDKHGMMIKPCAKMGIKQLKDSRHSRGK